MNIARGWRTPCTHPCFGHIRKCPSAITTPRKRLQGGRRHTSDLLATSDLVTVCSPLPGRTGSRNWPMRLFSKFLEGAAALGRREGVQAAAPTQNVAAVGAAPACAAHGHTHTPDSSIVTVEQSDWSSRLAGLSYKPLEKDSQAGRALDGAVDIAGSRLFFGGVIAALTGWAIAGVVTKAPDIWQIILQDVSSIQVCWGGSRWLQCSCHPGCTRHCRPPAAPRPTSSLADRHRCPSPPNAPAVLHIRHDPDAAAAEGVP